MDVHANRLTPVTPGSGNGRFCVDVLIVQMMRTMMMMMIMIMITNDIVFLM
jgi:hypothetical protein